MSDFFKTYMGRKFYEVDVPKIAKALEQIAEELKRANDTTEKIMVVCKTQEDQDGP